MSDKERIASAVVLGIGLNGLGVVRSLARAGVDVIAVDDDPDNPGMRTRYGRKLVVRALHGRALIEDLVNWGPTFNERPVLFVTREATVTTVSRYRDDLAPLYRLVLADADCLDALMHKESFRHMAERHGFRVPRSRHVTDDETFEAARDLRFPVILKPAKRDAAYARAFDKAYRVADFEALARLCRKMMPVLPDLIVQEWIEGADADLYFCLQYVGEDGEPAASFTGRKIRSWPPHTGGTASCTAAPEVAAELAAETTRFFKATGFIGMGGMEFKRDAVSGDFYLIEPTVGRTDYQEEVATLNGINIPLAAWQSALGLGVQPQRTCSRPVVWRESSVDRWSAELQKERAGRGALDSGRKVDGWWRWYDPMPAAQLFGRRVSSGIRKRIGRIKPARIAT